jgi:hypothetical protein
VRSKFGFRRKACKNSCSATAISPRRAARTARCATCTAGSNGTIRSLASCVPSSRAGKTAERRRSVLTLAGRTLCGPGRLPRRCPRSSMARRPARRRAMTTAMIAGNPLASTPAATAVVTAEAGQNHSSFDAGSGVGASRIRARGPPTVIAASPMGRLAEMSLSLASAAEPANPAAGAGASWANA